ncbi:GSCFA domain-containing protein [Parasphingopyxis sp. CP4]|uniref:GSCFA domain-containing protein n=1 Tax=Parasphingopyxis sp. CP4 TaxID=2724527 RepID=UPI0015A1EA7A|nr:GSCFA domain-containing protein [Parasphingopyxis sp. CP4]QLC20911.1 GSCFA domain-containing protein [Parasphingopyxis sp. CP4]
MPIASLNGPAALRIRKANTLATWGVRGEDNRVEPIAKPAFDVPFSLVPGESIFTIGSCFARHVEGELRDQGFRIPMRELFSTKAFENLPPAIVNNFGTPSIYNEFAWAFGEQEFDETQAIVKVGADKYADLHMVNSVRPAPREEVLARRRGLMEATRSLADCRILIMTLGLAEVWWDEEAQTYLNTSPLPGIMKASPERFSLHVLSYQECHDYLRKALDIAFKHGRDDLRVIMTVSPVPMMATHRREDVMTANCYSKSVLRAVAEQIVVGDERIVYFPSYESVTLTDRRVAWSEDLVHTTREIVEFNVKRMVNAYVGNENAGHETLPVAADFPIESAAALLLADKARNARMKGDKQFFEEHADQAAESETFAIEYGRFLLAEQRPKEALAVLKGLEQSDTRLLRAQAHLALQNFDAVLAAVRPLCNRETKGVIHWNLMIEARRAKEGKQGVLDVEKLWLKTQPKQRMVVQTHIGNTLSKMKHHEAAILRLRPVAEADEDTPPLAFIACARSLLATGDLKGAKQLLDTVTPRTEWQVAQIKTLLNEVSNHPG